MDDDPEFLREQAAKCRRLAKTISSQSGASRLLDLAEDYERRAVALDELPAEAPDPGS